MIYFPYGYIHAVIFPTCSVMSHFALAYVFSKLSGILQTYCVTNIRSHKEQSQRVSYLDSLFQPFSHTFNAVIIVCLRERMPAFILIGFYMESVFHLVTKLLFSKNLQNKININLLLITLILFSNIESRLLGIWLERVILCNSIVFILVEIASSKVCSQ